MHIVDFITRIYHDTLSPESQKKAHKYITNSYIPTNVVHVSANYLAIFRETKYKE